MNESDLYLPLWEKYRPIIISKMKLALTETQSYPFSRHEFEAVGEKLRLGYTFNLEVDKGLLLGKKDESPIARDFLAVVKKSKTGMELIQENYFQFKLSKDFKLKIQTTKVPATKVADTKEV